MADGPQAYEIEASWVGAEDLPVQFANAFAGVVGPNAAFLDIGSVVPPAINGATQEEREAQMQAIGFLPIKPVARLALAREGLDELISTLEQMRENFDTLKKAIESGEAQK
jgi:hypothetical protein